MRTLDLMQGVDEVTLRTVEQLAREGREDEAVNLLEGYKTDLTDPKETQLLNELLAKEKALGEDLERMQGYETQLRTLPKITAVLRAEIHSTFDPANDKKGWKDEKNLEKEIDKLAHAVKTTARETGK